MNLYNSIHRRKSCRDYLGQTLPDSQLDAVHEAIKDFARLYPDVELEHRIVSQTKGPLRVQAPHYLIVSGQGRDGELESAGFLFEQLVLWFDAQELGCVWLGAARDIEANKGGKDIIAIAFGHSTEPPHRMETEFNRKLLKNITNDPTDACIQAVNLAPSGMNLQPWYLEKAGDKVLLYRQKSTSPASLLYKKTDVDMGIALCHYYLACKHLGKPFRFTKTSEGPDKKGYTLFGELQGSM